VSVFLKQVQSLIAEGAYEISSHAFGKFDNERIVFQDIMAGMADAVVIEDYPGYHKGPSVLVKLTDRDGFPVHALWGIPAGKEKPVYLVTAYRPDPARWSADFLMRRPK
jgi:hypothetical protein